MKTTYIKVSDLLAALTKVHEMMEVPLFMSGRVERGLKIIFDRLPKISLGETERKYLPTLSELVDRLSILSIKEVKIPEHKQEYAQEIQDILADINSIITKDSIKFNAETIRAIIICAQSNLHIWVNESSARKGNKDGNNLLLTHSINGIRSRAKNKIQEINGGRKDYKVDCLAADFKDWIPSGWEI